MKKVFYILTALFFTSNIVFGQKLSRTEYIEKYKNIAIQQMQAYGIPASIILAQACLESSNGNSELTREGKNHFGIKCAGWQGNTIYHDDDERDECFRAYKTDEDSFLDHSDFLRYRKRYASLFDLNPTDYKGWAKGLKKAGYATAPDYAQSLINIIEDFQLYQYDNPQYVAEARTEIEQYSEREAAENQNNQAENYQNENNYQNNNSNTNVETKIDRDKKPQNNYNAPAPTYAKLEPVKKPSAAEREYNIDNFVIHLGRNVNLRNGVKYVTAKANDNYERIADEFNISANQLRLYNDDKKNNEIKEGDAVYIERKKAKAGKDFPMHIAEDGETMRDIAQMYAVRLYDLRKNNNMPVGMEPKGGQPIFLRNQMRK